MALDRTAGYDMLVQLSENELNTQLETAFVAGGAIPQSLSVPFSTGGATGTANINFDVPTIDLDRTTPNIGLTIPFENSELDVTAPLPLSIAPLGGTIEVIDAVEVVAEGTNRIVALNFTNGAPTVTVSFNAASAALLAPVLAATSMTLAQVENMFAGFIVDTLVNDIERIDLSPAIPTFDDTDPLTVFDIDAGTTNDTSVADRDCLNFGIKTGSDSGGNISLITQSMIPAGQDSIVMLSNFWLLGRVLRPMMADSLGVSATAFDLPLRLNTTINAPGGEGQLTNLEARVEGNRIRIDGRAIADGTGWDAQANFTFFVSITLDGGAINITATEPVVDTDVDLAWWVWLIGLGLGGLFGGIIGAIVAAIVLAIVVAVAEGLVDNLIGDGLSGAVGGIPSLPLGPLGDGISLDSVVLDDLEFRSSIVRSVGVPIKNQGSTSSSNAFSLDLDSGVVNGTPNSNSDAAWMPGLSLEMLNASTFTQTGVAFDSLTPVQIAKMGLSRNALPVAAIPIGTAVSAALNNNRNETVIGVRTSRSRLAKIGISKSSNGATVNIRWITYDNPTPSISIGQSCSISERGDVTEYIKPDCSYCTRAEVAHCCVLEAKPKLMAFPVNYQWCLCGETLKDKEGEVSSPGGIVSYKICGKRLFLETDLGQSFHCEVCISAVDAQGIEQYSCTKVSLSGIEEKCKKCTPAREQVDYHFAAALAPSGSYALFKSIVGFDET